MTKLCKDCIFCVPVKHAWFYGQGKYEFARCWHPDVVTPPMIDPVSGDETPASPIFCTVNRKSYGECKPEGDLFEAKAGAA